MDIRSLLVSVPGLSTAPAEDLEQVARAAAGRAFSRRTRLVREHERDAPLVIVESGLAKVCRTSAEGRELLLDVIRPGELAGSCCGSLITGLSECGVVGLTPGVAAIVPGGAWRELLRARPGLRAAFLDHILHHRQRCVSLAAQLALGSVDGRLGSLLMRLAGYRDDSPAESRSVPPVLTQDEIAAAIGTVREVVTRHLAGLVERGMLAREGRRIIVRDPGALTRLCARL